MKLSVFYDGHWPAIVAAGKDEPSRAFFFGNGKGDRKHAERDAQEYCDWKNKQPTTKRNKCKT